MLIALSHVHKILCTYLLRKTTFIRGEGPTNWEVAGMPTLWKVVPIISWRETAICGDSMPLKQYKIATQSRRKLEPVLIVQSLGRRRKVGTVGIFRVELALS